MGVWSGTCDSLFLLFPPHTEIYPKKVVSPSMCGELALNLLVALFWGPIWAFFWKCSQSSLSSPGTKYLYFMLIIFILTWPHDSKQQETNVKTWPQHRASVRFLQPDMDSIQMVMRAQSNNHSDSLLQWIEDLLTAVIAHNRQLPVLCSLVISCHFRSMIKYSSAAVALPHLLWCRF